ncbi:MAG: flavin-containing monooxygenase [Chitinophagales bacterium]
MTHYKNVIIGAGPAGLAVAGRMRKAGLDFQILEQSKNVGNSWRKHYDRLHLHTVKKWSHLPHMPFPDDYPTYVSRQQLVDYMDNYAQHFDIKPIYGKEITWISKVGDKWQIQDQKGEIITTDHVVMATGLNRSPHIPIWKGQDDFTGTISHSINYKNPKPYLEQKVLVVGIGNTGAEIALDLSNSHIETHIAVRGEISLVPRDLNGRPVQETAKILEKLPFGFGDWLGGQIRKIYFGDLSKYGLKVSKIHPVALLRDTGKTPLIDIGTIAAIKAGKITVQGDIDHFTKNGVQFKNGKHIELDAVILATGYRSKIESLVERANEMLDTYGLPKNAIGVGHHKGLFFVGFDNYKTGGILGTIHNDSETVVHSLQHKKTA